MCLGNRAEVASHYINAQLVALWDNAKVCTQKHSTGLKHTRAEVEYGTLLFEFFGPGKHVRKAPSKEDLAFYAKFDAPRLEFVCNHEVVLFLKIKEGHYNLDTAKASTKKYLERIDDYTLAFRLDFNIASIEGFQCKTIGNADAYTLDLFILDIATATFSPELSSLSTLDIHSPKLTSLIYYLTTYYLPTLKRAGHHVLHSLPDFDNLTSTTAHIDYSVIAGSGGTTTNNSTLATREIHGVRVDDVNAYLKGLWLTAAAHVDEHQGSEGKDGAVEKSYLAEHKSVWTNSTEDVHFEILFGPLEVQALCKREVVLYVDIQDIYFHLGGGFSKQAQHKCSNWKIALIVDIKFEEADAGNVRRLKLDLSTARPCEHLSTMDATDIPLETLNRLRSTLVRYITRQYLTILQTAGDDKVYHHDKRIHSTSSGSGSGSPTGGTFEGEGSEEEGAEGEGAEVEDEDCYCEGECTCVQLDATGSGAGGGGATGGVVKERVQWGNIEKDRVASTSAGDYDQVTAVTQGAVNLQFKAVWELARRKAAELKGKIVKTTEEIIEICLAEYAYVQVQGEGEKKETDVFFQSTFNAPQMQLLCAEGSKSVVYYLQMIDGHMKTLDRNKGLIKGGEKITFGNWRVAFEVPLKLQDCSNERPAPADLLKRLGRTSHNSFKQLVLDFASAKFSLARSTIPGLLDGKNSKLIRNKHVALLHYLTTYYLPTLVHAGHDVLYTIPMSDGTATSSSALTALSFQIVPFTFGSARGFVEGLFGRQRGLFERNMIVFTGMNGGKALPAGLLPRGSGGNWVGGGATGGKDAIQHGTICLSRKTFLEGKILAMFQKINRETTVLPSFSGIQASGEWILKLTTWEKHEVKKNFECKFKELKGSEESLEFEWRNKDEWRYEHEGDEGNNGLYSVVCTTRNTLSVPTTHRHDGSFAIVIQGTVDLALAYAGEGQNWDTKMQSTWAAAINFTSDVVKGLEIHTSPAKIVPKFTGTHERGTIGHSTFAIAFQDLQKQLPSVLDFARIVKELRTAFDGAQSQFYVKNKDQILRNPIFNRRGDLLVEIHVRGTAEDVAKAKATASTGRPGAQHRDSWFRQVKHKVGEVFHQSRGSVVLSTTSLSTSSPGLSRTASKKSYASAASAGGATPTGKGTQNGHSTAHTTENESIYESASDDDV